MDVDEVEGWPDVVPVVVPIEDGSAGLELAALEGEELPLAGDALDEVLAGIEGSLCEKAE